MRTAPDGRLLVSYADPQGYGDPTQGALAVKAADGSWSVVTSMTDHPPVHDFSALVRDNGDLVVVGADGTTTPCCWISTDDGATWTYELIVAPTVEVEEIERAWTVQEISGVLHTWVNASDFGSPETGVYTRDDDTGLWAKIGTAVVQSSSKVTVSGTTLALTLSTGPGAVAVAGGSLRTQPPGALSTWEADGVYALNVAADGTAWWLTSSGELHRGNTDGTTALVATVPDSTVRCLAVDSTGGRVFFGTTDSRVLVADLPGGTT